MKKGNGIILGGVVLTAMIILFTVFMGFKEFDCEDTYLEVPAVALLPQPRMKPAVAHPKTQAGRGLSEINDRELYLLAKIIECEARYEPYDGKVAVGAVVLNRVMSGRFPNTIEGVIFQKGQFQPMTDGGWEGKEPSDQAFNAAREALQGVKPTGENGQTVGNALFFIYENLADQSAANWFKNKLSFVTSIGNHDFYSH